MLYIQPDERNKRVIERHTWLRAAAGIKNERYSNQGIKTIFQALRILKYGCAKKLLQINQNKSKIAPELKPLNYMTKGLLPKNQVQLNHW
ncbi:MAG: hypothetical protein JW731_03440 [Bacteroidales bacterium]|nr:hypothetical protein [Bacteroidales bacterium]